MAPTTLHVLQSRRATFNKSRKGANRALNWPHPLTNTASKPSSSTIHPDHLAAAGFYSTPTAEEPTRSTCYLCESVVDSWEEGDDPLSRHLELNDSCGWAVLQQLQGDWAPYEGTRDKKEWAAAFGKAGELHPRSERVRSARASSFSVGWPHTEVKGVPTAEEIAEAGWFFSGGSEDNCVCPYCSRTVEGWEAGDKPEALHNRKLGEKCPFYKAEPPLASSLATSKAKGRKVFAATAEDAPAPPAKLSRSKAQSRLAQQVEDEVEDEEQPSQPQLQPARASRRTKTTAPSSDGPETSVVGDSLRASRSTRNKKAESIVSASAPPSVVEEGEDEPEEPTHSQATRGGSRRVQQVEVVVDIPIKSKRAPAAKGKATKGKAAKSKKVDVDIEEVEEAPVVQEELVEEAAEGEGNDAMEEDEPAPTAAAAPKKASRSKSASSKSAGSRSRSTKTKEKSFVVAEDTVEEAGAEEMEEAARLANQFLEAEQSIVAEEPQQPAKKPQAKVKGSSTSTSKKISPVAINEPAPEPESEVRGPLTPTVASPSPRPIRSLPSKVNSPSTTSANLKPSSAAQPRLVPSSLNATYTAPASLFPGADSPLPPLTPAELSMTLAEYYTAQSRATYEATETALRAEYELLERRIEQGRKKLETMLEAAKTREKRERASPRKMRA